MPSPPDNDSSDEMDVECNDTLSSEQQPSSGGKQTLKRGDACLACRRRRIRCNAEKPACATCVRLKKQCVYETGKTTSRIALLKARISELENQLQTRSPGATPAPENHRTPATTAAAAAAAAATSAHTINPAALGFAIPSVQGSIFPISPAPGVVPLVTTPHGNHSSGTSTGPSAPQSHAESPRSGRPYAQSSNPRPPGEPDPHFDFDLSFLDQPVADLSAHMYMTAVTPPADGATGVRRWRRRDFVESVGGIENVVAMGLMGSATADRDDDTAELASEMLGLDANGDISILPSLPQGRELVGGWFDPNDVPPAVRDHLLDLFFSRLSAQAHFSITIHLPRFYMRLTLPPAKRPHPGLLYSMYATAARVSSQPAIKQLESQFFEIADKQIRLAVANHDRLLDALRGMALLTNYLFAKEKYSVGYHMCGAAVRLAISCGLDRIPTSVWTPAPPFNAAIHCTLRTGGYAIPPPEDPIDLAERIYAFWAVYETDLCTAVGYLWHTGLPMEDIRTPFPRPLIEYELGLVSTVDDLSIDSVLDPKDNPRGLDNSFIVLRMKALTLLARVLKLRQERPEVAMPDMSTEPVASGPHVCSYPGSSLPPYATHPTGFAKVKAALDYYVDHLPDEHRPPWRWDEGEDVTLPRVALSRESSVLHFLVGNAYMQLWNMRALDSDNSVALLVARRLVNVMYLYQTEPLSTGYDIFIITIWNEVAMVLVREMKRLQHVGETARAQLVDADLSVAIAAMKKWGDVDIAAEHDGKDIAVINGKMLEQLRLMSQEDWAEAMQESRRRYGGIDPVHSKTNVGHHGMVSGGFLDKD